MRCQIANCAEHGVGPQVPLGRSESMDKLVDCKVLDDLACVMKEFFEAVSFEVGERPSYDRLTELLIDSGLLIKNSGSTPEISDVSGFIATRQAAVDALELTSFKEAEVVSKTEIFGRVAQRISVYTKEGVLNGLSFATRGVIFTQLIQTAEGWKISSMAWDDERPGLKVTDFSAKSVWAAPRR